MRQRSVSSLLYCFMATEVASIKTWEPTVLSVNLVWLGSAEFVAERSYVTSLRQRGL